MGGPAAGILLRRIPDDDQVATLRAWLGRLAEFRTGPKANIRQGWELFVRWPVAFGDEPPDGVCLGSLQLFVLDHAAEYTGASCLTPNDWTRIEKAIGWMPVAELSVGIFCNRPRDHKTLAWVCERLADKLGGIVDLGGQIPIPASDEWPEVGLTGSVFEATYETVGGQMAAVHLVDSRFLREWIRQPNFHMIK